MRIELREISDLLSADAAIWKVRALVIDGRDPVNAALARWRKEHPNDYKAILKVMRLAAQQRRVLQPKHVKKSGNPQHGEVYEMIAYTGIARVLFFYDEGAEALIVCTTDYEKGRGSQDAAFARCADLREIYRKHRP